MQEEKSQSAATLSGLNVQDVYEGAFAARDHVVQRKAPGTKNPLAVINVNSQIRSQLFSLFIDSYMPSSPSGQIKYRFQPAPNLVPLLPSLVDGNNSQLLDRATSALASVFVGKKFNNDQLANHGMLLYNHAIQMFLRILPRAGIPVQEVLCANLIFQLYEVINCSSGFAGWTAHMQGANAVLARHQGNMKKDQVSAVLVRHIKLSNVSLVLELSYSLPRDDIIDDLIDILLTCTELVERMAQVQSINDAANVIQFCLHVKWKTEAWDKELRAKYGDTPFTMAPESNSSPRSVPSRTIFSEIYQFAAPDIAEAYMLYWSALLMIFSVLHGAELWRHSDLSGSDEDKTAYHQNATLFLKSAEYYANQICRGVGYFIQPDMHILGGHSVLFPMAMASQFFYRHGFIAHFQWCQEVLTALETVGLGLANVIQGTPWDRYKVGES
ncbi:hypothetical protein N7541_009598 [Penicillium brevicompactum]|uniref:Uncharacterized protein n=1 Tax=Penicillium brevicompactum TaxID=5074 RepID=A0A9W9UHE9_PENBR|nr:hypothetical protein N7541_009598 [Penicillium brevicompactum]